MKGSEMRGLSKEDLIALKQNMVKRVFELKVYGSNEESPDVKEHQKLRRDIARCKTFLRQIEVAEKKEAL